jgi:hypothetical protein
MIQHLVQLDLQLCTLLLCPACVRQHSVESLPRLRRLLRSHGDPHILLFPGDRRQEP